MPKWKVHVEIQLKHLLCISSIVWDPFAPSPNPHIICCKYSSEFSRGTTNRNSWPPITQYQILFHSPPGVPPAIDHNFQIPVCSNIEIIDCNYLSTKRSNLKQSSTVCLKQRAHNQSYISHLNFKSLAHTPSPHCSHTETNSAHCICVTWRQYCQL